MSPLPSLSEVENASWDYLTSCAEQWKKLADTWEKAFTEVRTQSMQPGGTEWTGTAADAAQHRTDGDMMRARGPGEQLRDAAKVAERGRDQQKAGRRAALSTVDDVRRDGFNVAEDYTVTDAQTDWASPDEYFARQRAARDHEEFIKFRVGQLVSGEDALSRDLTAATRDLDGFRFPDEEGDGGAGAGQPNTSDAPGAKPGEPGGPEFVIGPPTKPDIEHDEGFEYGSAKPDWHDYASRAEWEAKLAGGRLLRPDLDDATQMYQHYWDNDGKPIKFDYEEAFREDPAIRANVEDQISRAQRGAEDLIRDGNTSFSMTGDPALAPSYPTTENWQKAIGGYQQWSSADVRVDGNKVTMTVTVHAEDHYNFNRGQSDIATGAADNVNGRFTELGWAKPFDSHGEVTRTVTWDLGSAPTTYPGHAPAFNPGREDRVDGLGSSGSLQFPTNDRSTGSARVP